MPPNVKTNVVSYPEPTQAGFLFAALDDQGNPDYTWHESTVTEPPVFSVVSGTSQTALVIRAESPTAGATIYYTVDGSPATENSPVWSGNQTLTQSAEFRAIAKAPGLVKSDAVLQAFTITSTVLSLPIGRSSPLAVRQSVDSGATWTEWPVVPDLSGKYYADDYMFYAFGSGILALTTGCWISISRDRGVTWNHMFMGFQYKYTYKSNGTTYGPYDSAAMVGNSYWVYYLNGKFFTPVALYSGPANPDGGAAVYSSVDGVTWDMDRVPAAGLPSNPSFGYPNSGGGYPRNTGMAYRNGVYILVVEGKGVLRSVDGHNWTFIAVTGMNSSVYSLISTPWGFAFNDGSGVLASVDEGLTWTRKGSGSSYGNIICYLKNANKTVAMLNYDGAQAETMDGVGWTLTKAPYDYPNRLSGCASSDKVDLFHYDYGRYSAPILSIYAGFVRPDWLSSTLPMPIKITQASSDTYYPPCIVWTGSHFVFVNKNENTIARSPDGADWTVVPKPFNEMASDLVIDDNVQAPALVTPGPIPAPVFAVPSGSYPCETAGVDGNYQLIFGCIGYSVVFTCDDSVDLATVDLSTAVMNMDIENDGIGMMSSSNGSSFRIKAGATKTVRAIARAIDGRKSPVASVTITATQI